MQRDSEIQQKDLKTKKKEVDHRKIPGRVIDRNKVYMMGIPEQLLNLNKIKSPALMGQYGQIVNVKLGESFNLEKSQNTRYSAYVTFKSKMGAALAIACLNHFKFDGERLDCSYGTNKFCSFFRKHQKCSRREEGEECPFIHYNPYPWDYIKEEDFDQPVFYRAEKAYAIKYINDNRELLFKVLAGHRIPKMPVFPTLGQVFINTSVQLDDFLKVYPKCKSSELVQDFLAGKFKGEDQTTSLQAEKCFLQQGFIQKQSLQKNKKEISFSQTQQQQNKSHQMNSIQQQIERDINKNSCFLHPPIIKGNTKFQYQKHISNQSNSSKNLSLESRQNNIIQPPNLNQSCQQQQNYLQQRYPLYNDHVVGTGHQGQQPLMQHDPQVYPQHVLPNSPSLIKQQLPTHHQQDQQRIGASTQNEALAYQQQQQQQLQHLDKMQGNIQYPMTNQQQQFFMPQQNYHHPSIQDFSGQGYQQANTVNFRYNRPPQNNLQGYHDQQGGQYHQIYPQLDYPSSAQLQGNEGNMGQASLMYPDQVRSAYNNQQYNMHQTNHSGLGQQQHQLNRSSYPVGLIQQQMVPNPQANQQLQGFGMASSLAHPEPLALQQQVYQQQMQLPLINQALNQSFQQNLPGQLLQNLNPGRSSQYFQGQQLGSTGRFNEDKKFKKFGG